MNAFVDLEDALRGPAFAYCPGLHAAHELVQERPDGGMIGPRARSTSPTPVAFRITSSGLPAANSTSTSFLSALHSSSFWPRRGHDAKSNAPASNEIGHDAGCQQNYVSFR